MGPTQRHVAGGGDQLGLEGDTLPALLGESRGKAYAAAGPDGGEPANRVDRALGGHREVDRIRALGQVLDGREHLAVSRFRLARVDQPHLTLEAEAGRALERVERPATADECDLARRHQAAQVLVALRARHCVSRDAHKRVRIACDSAR